MLARFRSSQEADGMNQYDYRGYQFGSVVARNGLWNFVDRKADTVLTAVFRLTSDSIMALLVLLVMRLFASDQSEKATNRPDHFERARADKVIK